MRDRSRKHCLAPGGPPPRPPAAIPTVLVLVLAIAAGSAPARADEYLVGQGLGDPNPNRVRIFQATGAPTAVDFLAYAAGHWGVNVAAGSIDGGTESLVTGPGPGGVFGPQVRGFTVAGAPLAKVNFYAYGTLRFGVNAVAGDLDNDGFQELTTGAGPGAVFGPHVRAFDYDGAAVAAIAKVSFFAYATLKYGVNVDVGDLDGDAFAELVTGAGPSAAFGPQVRAFDFDGGTVGAIGPINYFACGATAYGVNVAAGDVDADGFDEIATTPGPGPANPSRFCAVDFDASSVTPLAGFDVTPFSTGYGGRVGLGDIDGDGSADLLAAAGRDPVADSTVAAYTYGGSTLTQMAGSFEAFPGTFFGANVATAEVPATGSGHVTYRTNNRLYRVEAVAGGAVEDISTALDALAPGGGDGWLNSSPDGQWLLVETERFDPGCQGWACLVLLDGAATTSYVVRSSGQLLHPGETSAIASGGGLIVYPDSGGPHARDLWVVTGNSTIGFGAPLLLTASSPYDFNAMPALKDDGSSVLFDCGDQPYGAAGTAICEVGTSGSGLRVVLTPADAPPGYSPGGALHHADYAPDGSIVFESAWAGEQIWRLPAGASVAVLVGASFGNDNSPCVLPDSRIASLWLQRPGGSSQHEMKVMDAAGGNYSMLVINQDVDDIGLSCSP